MQIYIHQIIKHSTHSLSICFKDNPFSQAGTVPNHYESIVVLFHTVADCFVLYFVFFFLKFAVEGVIGLSWGFGLPLYDVIRGTVVDYMHCVCEGVVDQLISQWFNKANSKQSFYLGSKEEEISKELTGITPTCEITRTPRSLADVKDWKGNKP